MKLFIFFIGCLSVLTNGFSQKSKLQCLSGNCKNGEGIQLETIRYPKSVILTDGRLGDSYKYFIHIATFKDGVKQGKGLRLELSYDNSQCLEEIKDFVGKKDPNNIPHCNYLKSIDQVVYKNNDIDTGLVISFPFIDKIRQKSGWYAYENENVFSYANHYITQYEIPTNIVLYKHLISYTRYTYYNGNYSRKKKMEGIRANYRIDSILINFDNGDYYSEKHKYDGSYYERLKDSVLQISYAEKNSKWLLSTKNYKNNHFTREIFFLEKNILYQWNPCEIFSFPADQENYKEMHITSSVFYKGGTRNNKPHGFGIMIETLDSTIIDSNDSLDIKKYACTERIYTGYFINGKKSCTGLETKRLAVYSYHNKSKKLEKVSPTYTMFGKYENNHLVYGKTLIYEKSNDIVYDGAYSANRESIYPYYGTRYKREIPSGYTKFKLVKTDEGYFDKDGNLVSGKNYDSYGNYTLIQKDGTTKNMVKAVALYLEDVILIDGVEKIVVKKDINGNIYCSDGTFINSNTIVERLSPDKKNKFMCTCPKCDGLGYIIKTNTYTQTSTYNTQKTDYVDYLGYKVVKTYKVTETTTRTHTTREYCKNCSGEGKFICK